MNPLHGLVESQFRKPNLLLALVFVVSPFLYSILFSIVFGFEANYTQLGIAMLRALAFWVLAGLLMYVLLTAFKGRETKGKFRSIISVLSINSLITTVVSALFTVIIFVAIPGFIQKIASLQGKYVAFDQMLAVVKSLALPSTPVLLLMAFIMLVVGVASIAAVVYVLYKTGQMVKRTGPFSNIVFVVVFSVLSFMLDFAISLILSFFR